MLAHAQGGLFNASKLVGGLGVKGQTVARYADLLVDLLLVRRLMPYHANTRKQLVRSPKVYIRDSGLVQALLGIRDRRAPGCWSGLGGVRDRDLARSLVWTRTPRLLSHLGRSRD